MIQAFFGGVCAGVAIMVLLDYVLSIVETMRDDDGGGPA